MSTKAPPHGGFFVGVFLIISCYSDLMFKEFFKKKMLERQLKDLPEGQREQIMGAMERNPELFEKIAREIKAGTKRGKPEMAVSMEVMRKYQGELQKAMMGK